MRAVLFIREDLLAKAAHYKTIQVHGHIHNGKWVDTYTKRALVSDDHSERSIAAF